MHEKDNYLKTARALHRAELQHDRRRTQQQPHPAHAPRSWTQNRLIGKEPKERRKAGSWNADGEPQAECPSARHGNAGRAGSHP